MLHVRGSTYWLKRRVPRRYASVERRDTVWVSLKTDSRHHAEQKAAIVWDEFLASWEARLAGDAPEADRRYDAARHLADLRGFQYLPAAAVAQLPVSELLERVEAVQRPDGTPDRREARAVLGGVAEVPITVSRALELYWQLADDRLRGKSADQARRWRNPRIKAVRNFTNVVGDKPLGEISGDDMIAFRSWWLDRMQEANLSANSANKDLVHLGDVLKTVNEMKRLGLDLPLSGYMLKEGEATTRPPFGTDWIRERLLAPGALDGLNAEARAIVLGMVNTGYRPSEGAALTPDDIRLDAEVPHIRIEPGRDRQLKTVQSRRAIPLVGVSLDAFQAFPAGFPRYRESSASLSGLVNKVLRHRGLLESPRHSLYSLRHSFEDRLLEAGVDERIRRDLMGHSLGRQRYGDGGSLAYRRDVLARIAL